MLKKPVFVWFILVAILGVSSCSNYQKLYKSDDVDAKYEMALKYYNQENYYRALELLEAVIPFYRGTEKAEDLYYYYAYSHYHQGDNILASYYFKRFTKTFPQSKYTDECLFMAAYCKYLDSPIYSLDQTSTVEALVELQLYMDVFPDSERIEEANELMENLRNKLEKKAFEIAKLYIRMEDYKAAITSFKSLLESFPDSRYQEPVLFNIAKAQYFYALHSIESKKKERFIEMIEVYDAYIVLYPDSEHAKQVTTYYNNSREYLLSN